MANIQIPNLPVAIALNGTEQMEAVQAGTSVRLDVNQIVQYAINYVFNLSSAPKVVSSDYAVQDGDVWLIANSSTTLNLTLPVALNNIGRVITIKNLTNNPVLSVSSDVVSMENTAPSTAILPALSGTYVTMVSDGYNWIVMSTNVDGQNNLVWG